MSTYNAKTEGGDEFLRKYGGALFKGGTGKKAVPLNLLSGESVAPSPFHVGDLRTEPALRRFFELGVYAQSYLCQWVFPKSLVRHFLSNLAHLNVFARGRLVSPEAIFREVFQMKGGEILPAEGEIFLEPHREKGVSFWRTPEDVVNGTVCLLAVSPEDAPEFFERSHVSSKRWRTKEELEEVGYRIADILFTTDVGGIPGGMGENLMLYTGAATEPFTPSELAYLSWEKSEASGSREGHYTVFYEGDRTKDETKDWAKAQIARLERLFPFMTAHLSFEKVLVGDGHPLAPDRYYTYGTRKRRLGTPRIKEGIFGKNTYFIDRRQMDYMGLEGEILTAFKATRWALERLTKL